MPNAKPRLLLLLHTETYRARDFLTAAQRLGIDLLVASDEAEALAQAVPGRALALDYLDVEGSVERIAQVHGERPLDAVVAPEDPGLVVAARAAERLGLPTNPSEATVAAADKAVFREIVEAAGLPGPWYRTFPADADPAAVAREAPYPCVLKPTFLSASRGVIRADEPAGFAAAFERIRALLADPDVRRRGGRRAERVLVESYTPGAEVALEGLLADGTFHLLAFLDKPEPMEGPYFEETLFVTPSRHPEHLQRAAVETVQRGVEALGLRQGPVHAELRLNGDTPVLLEVAARSIGGHCSRALRFGEDMALEELILRQAVGMPPGPAEREGAASGVMMLPIPAGGRLRAVHGEEAARAVPGITDLEITVPLGETVVPLPEGHRYLGFLFARAETPGAVEQALRKAHGRLRFDIAPE